MTATPSPAVESSTSAQTTEAASEASRFTVTWEEPDPANPRNLGLARRWLIVILVSTGSLCVYVFFLLLLTPGANLPILTEADVKGSTCASSIYTTTYAQVTEEFRISQIVATLGLSFFIWGLGKIPGSVTPT